MQIPTQNTAELLSAGAKPGVMEGMAYLGLQQKNFLSGPKTIHELWFRFVFPTVLKSDGRPFSIDRTITLSLHEMSALRPLLEGWFGRQLTPSEITDIDLFDLLGRSALVNVVHNKSNDGRVFANIASLSELPAEIETPVLNTEPIKFDLGAWDPVAFDRLPRWVQEKIQGRVTNAA